MVDKNFLVVGKNKIDCVYPICTVQEFLELNTAALYVVLVNGSEFKTQQPKNNIFAVRYNGMVIWRIQDYIPGERYYTKIAKDKQGHLIVEDVDGYNYVLDLNNYTVLEKYQLEKRRIYFLEKNILNINGKKLDFTYHIAQVKESKGILVLCTNNPESDRVADQPINNIFAVDNQGNLLWTITELIPEDNLYTGIRIEDGQLVAVNFGGTQVVIDLAQKAVVQTYDSK